MLLLPSSRFEKLLLLLLLLLLQAACNGASCRPAQGEPHGPHAAAAF
jgi:hypothetical protein